MRRASGKQQCELAQIKQLLADEKAENAKLREVIERQGLQNVVQLQEQIKSLKDEKVLLEIALDEAVRQNDESQDAFLREAGKKEPKRPRLLTRMPTRTKSA